jgi:hypothetical protein
LVLTVGRLDALEGVGVRADDVVFVVRRGLLNDMLSGQVCVNRMLQVQVQAARYWDIVSMGNPSIMQSTPDESQLNRVKVQGRQVKGGPIESCPNRGMKQLNRLCI